MDKPCAITAFLSKIEQQRKPVVIVVGFLLIGLIGIVDALTGYETAFSLFYVIPIALVTWAAGRWVGSSASFVSALAWIVADWASGHPYSHPLIPIWNTLIRLSFFLIITVLLSTLRRALKHEKELARLDNLTGAVNSRFFYELAQQEIDRFQRYRHPFTFAYLDLDNFKMINDRFGHVTGDQALCTVVNFIRQHLRNTDVIARLGGDEFAVLFPETDADVAQTVISKIQQGLIDEMQRNNWPITFSIGVLTCRNTPPPLTTFVQMADELMYAVKHDRKNGAKFAVYEG